MAEQYVWIGSSRLWTSKTTLILFKHTASKFEVRANQVGSLGTGHSWTRESLRYHCCLHLSTPRSFFSSFFIFRTLNIKDDYWSDHALVVSQRHLHLLLNFLLSCIALSSILKKKLYRGKELRFCFRLHTFFILSSSSLASSSSSPYSFFSSSIMAAFCLSLLLVGCFFSIPYLSRIFWRTCKSQKFGMTVSCVQTDRQATGSHIVIWPFSLLTWHR